MNAMRRDTAKVRSAVGAAAFGLILIGVAGGADGRNPTVEWLEGQARLLADQAMRLRQVIGGSIWVEPIEKE